MNNNCIIYARISSNKQTKYNDSFLSIDTQISICDSYAKQNNYTITNTYTEVTSARQFKNQKTLQNIINTIPQNTTIIVSSISRFSRNMFEGLGALREMEKKNINLISVMDNLNYKTQQHWIRVKLSEAQEESDLISTRVKVNLQNIKDKGGYVNMPPYGYKIQRDESNIPKKIENSYEQAIIQFIIAIRIGLSTSKELSDMIKIISGSDIDLNFYDTDNDIIDKFNKPYTLEFDEIANILYDYNVKKKNKEWTGSMVANIFNRNKPNNVPSKTAIMSYNKYPFYAKNNIDQLLSAATTALNIFNEKHKYGLREKRLVNYKNIANKKQKPTPLDKRKIDKSRSRSNKLAKVI